MRRRWDLLASVGVVLLAGLSYLVLPDGSVPRVALALLVLLFIPGYLAIEACTRPDVTGRQRAARSWIALGASPAIVGLLALLTVLLPGGFRPGTIVATVTVGCLLLASTAWVRRSPAIVSDGRFARFSQRFSGRASNGRTPAAVALDESGDS